MATYSPKQFMNQVSSIVNSFKAEMTVALEVAVFAAEEHFDDSFKNQGFTDSTLKPWAPNAANTVERKGHDTILHNTGKLRDSRQRSVGNIGGNKIGSVWYKAMDHNVDYAYKNNNGFTNDFGKVPARKFLGKSKKLDARIKGIFRDRIRMIFNRNWTIGR